MKNLFIKYFSLLTFILLVISGCQKEEINLSTALLLEQSKELTLANKREFHGLLSAIWSINLEEKKRTSVETEKLENLFDEFEKFELRLEKANRTKAVELINQQYAKFKNDIVFKIPGFVFKPLIAEDLDKLNDDVFKAYAASKISRLYLDSAGYIFTSRSYGREPL